MRLYSGTSETFIKDTTHNLITDKLKEAFFGYYRYNPSPAELNSWRNSLRAMSLVFNEASFKDQGVILEYQLPLTSKRLDCIVCGKDDSGQEKAVIIELKQWEQCEESSGEFSVLTWLGGAKREVLHPAVQVGQYRRYLQDTHTSFYDEEGFVSLSSCSYLHNYNLKSGDHLLAPKFKEHVETNPIYTASEVPGLVDFLSSQVRKGDGIEVLKKIEEGKYKPNKKLMKHVSEVIKGKSEYILLDEQLVVYDKVLTSAREASSDKKVIIIKGGPGTGKSVIAINLMADLLRQGFNTHYSTGSKAFTETLRKIIGSRGSTQFKYFNSYMKANRNEIDVLIADEAHRIRKTSNGRFTRKDAKSDLSQLEELLKVARIGVFFIDDVQVVRPNEIGSAEYIKTTAEFLSIPVEEFELEAQFRCAGSDGFVNWVNNTLGIRRTANIIWEKNDKFDFQIFDTPEALKEAIFKKNSEGNSARLAAGFCWKWSDPNKDGTLPDDVIIGDFKMPWDAKPGARGLAKNIPSASLWAHDPNGIHQVGCVYTAQGFEFDYVGVIFGPDLRYDLQAQEWIGDKTKSADQMVRRSKEQFVDLVKNTYRVLLTRGMKGCYVHFMDKDTETYFRTRMEGYGRYR